MPLALLLSRRINDTETWSEMRAVVMNWRTGTPADEHRGVRPGSVSAEALKKNREDVEGLAGELGELLVEETGSDECSSAGEIAGAVLSVHDEQDDPDKLLMKVMLVSLVRDKVVKSPLLRGTHDEFCVRSCPGSFATAGTAGRRPGTGRHAHFPKQHLPAFVAKSDIRL